MAIKTNYSAAYLLQEGDIFKLFRDTTIAYKATKVTRSNDMVFIDTVKAIHGLNSIHVTDIEGPCIDSWNQDSVYIVTPN